MGPDRVIRIGNAVFEFWDSGGRLDLVRPVEAVLSGASAGVWSSAPGWRMAEPRLPGRALMNGGRSALDAHAASTGGVTEER
jgi:hypothetical protein